MATTDQPQQPAPCDALRALRAATEALATWRAHVEAYAADGDPAEVMAAARLAGIVTATLNGAACDTRAMARAASAYQDRAA